ncbi:MAG: AbiV family abortive infection protein [Nitrospira sp.]|nr:AbiV family abortive infection protein [Nitrospira sp.]
MSNENSHHEVHRSSEWVRRYADGAALIFTNAEALYDEAQLLGQAGHFARAAVLHQISMEECSKIDTLGAAATSILLGHDVDEARLAGAFRNHKAKNHANAFFARTTDEEMAARVRGDWKAAHEAFKKFQDKFYAEVNTIKNAGLYVDFQAGQFTAPVDAVDEPTAIAFQGVNAYFLKHCDNFLRLLRRMLSEPDFYAELTKNFVERLEGLAPLKIWTLNRFRTH